MVENCVTTIHFIRHGEVDNPAGVRYGRLPQFHISSNGRHEVEQTAHYLMRFPIRAIYTSPLERTQQTATLLALAHPTVPLHIDARIIENKTAPEFEGKPRSISYKYPAVTNPDAETTREIIDRMLDFCRFVVKTHPGQHIAAVSHGDPIGLLYHWLMFGVSDNPGLYLYPGYGSDWRFVWSNHTCKSVITTFLTDKGRQRQ